MRSISTSNATVQVNEFGTGNPGNVEEKITLVIPGISDLFCMSIRFLVQEIRDIQIIMVVPDCRQLRKLLDANSRCIIVTQYAWLKKSGNEEVRELLESYPNLKILMYLKPEEYGRAGSLYQAGIHGFFSDNIIPEEFQYCITQLSSGQSFFSQDIIPRLLSPEPERGRQSSEINLTSREHEILQLIVGGLTNKEIASRLCLSPRTVEGHRANLILKFGVRNTAELVSESMNMLELAS